MTSNTRKVRDMNNEKLPLQTYRTTDEIRSTRMSDEKTIRNALDTTEMHYVSRIIAFIIIIAICLMATTVFTIQGKGEIAVVLVCLTATAVLASIYNFQEYKKLKSVRHNLKT